MITTLLLVYFFIILIIILPNWEEFLEWLGDLIESKFILIFWPVCLIGIVIYIVIYIVYRNIKKIKMRHFMKFNFLTILVLSSVLFGCNPIQPPKDRDAETQCTLSKPRKTCTWNEDGTPRHNECYDGSVCTQDVCELVYASSEKASATVTPIAGYCRNPLTVPTKDNPLRRCDLALPGTQAYGMCVGGDCCPLQ